MIRPKCGYLELCIGPMRSGKSSYVALKLAKLADENFKCLFINNILDERDESMNVNTDGSFSRHGKTYFTLSKEIKCIKTDILSKIDVKDYDVIGIDECQFYGEEMVQTIKTWVNDNNKFVFCSGLDGDVHKNLFGHIYKLIPEADKIVKQSADCLLCQNEIREKGLLEVFHILNLQAPFSALIKTSSTHPQSQIHIGGEDTYASVCRYHHKTLMNLHNTT